ncbi:4'-phosphopantetheinyl transferase superfamily protein [Streptomyces sp. OF3]|uniref:4'-phosphopantetheinyl transferase superfamily protein n=1 Tax=Streptomyces alkaliterrae TaxID=2213162 RepID=A0A7W3WID6_9ACTN|nr:4'-phosphopantetheinyl transferase superfamily protein [Streptomyces alkaliterrae]
MGEGAPIRVTGVLLSVPPLSSRELTSLLVPPPAAELSADRPEVWLVRPGRHVAELPRASDVLSDAERRQAAAFRSESDRVLYTGAHVALRLLLGVRADVPPEKVEMVREPCPCCDKPHGRPALAGGGPHFSLSHSGDLALIALAATPVGADVERLPRARTVDEVAGSLHPREAKELAELPTAERPVAFARTWARKEAYLKGIGTGLGRNLDLDYVGSGPTPAAGPDGWRLADVAVDEGYAGAVALAPQGAES